MPTGHVEGLLGRTRHKLVSVQGVIQAGAQEHLGLVEQQHRVPQAAEHQGLVKGRLNNLRGGTEHPSAHAIERDARLLGHCCELANPLSCRLNEDRSLLTSLRCIRFANSWRPKHEDCDASSLTHSKSATCLAIPSVTDDQSTHPYQTQNHQNSLWRLFCFVRIPRRAPFHLREAPGCRTL